MIEEEQSDLLFMANLLYGHKRMFYELEDHKIILNGILTEEFRQMLDRGCKRYGINIEELMSEAGHDKLITAMLVYIRMDIDYFKTLPYDKLKEYHSMITAVQRALVFEATRK